MKNYEISVIIPVHNTEPTMLSNCIESVKEQEIGFANIELIVVLHNCNAETIETAEKLLSGYENVILAELNNDAHSPSSPRNHGIDKATGDYITFLDADDMLTPECLRLSLKYIKEADADICHFRRKLLMEKEGAVIFNEYELWDQTRETIVVDHDSWDQKKLFVGVWGICTARLYKRSLIFDNNLKFDESIKFAEDYHFEIGAYAAAKRICLAPQLIGYIYYVNSGSLVQTTTITEELLLDYVAGFKKVFDRGLQAGLWMNETMSALMLIIINWIFGCKDLSDEGKAKVRELMEPYIRMLTPVPPTKLYAGNRNDRINTMLTKYILGEEPKIVTFIKRPDEGRGQNLLDRQKDALARILRDGMDSDYSGRYGFPEIATIEEYQKKVPVSNYETYFPMIRLSTIMGEKGIFTDNEIIAYAFLDEEKNRIPVTYKAIVPYVNALRRSIGCEKTFVLAEALPFKASYLTMDYKYSNSIFGIMMKEYVAEAESFGSGYASFTTGKDQLFPTEPRDMTITRWVTAFREREVETIFSPDMETLSLRLRELTDHQEKICKELEAIDAERAKEIQEIFAAPDKLSLKALMPSLKRVVCWNHTEKDLPETVKPWLKGADFAPKYFADEYALYGEIDEDGNVALDPDDVFYEFLPVHAADEAAVCTVAAISEGEEYKVLLTNLCGLYRYDAGVCVTCVKKEENRLIVKILRRTK